MFQFEDFELDGVAFELRRAGHIVPLERIPTELLLLLAERSGQLVTRDEILERIWGKHVFIDATNAINTAVRKIRRALEDPANAPRFLITVPRKGYRFAAARCQTAGQQALITDVAFEPAGRALVAEEQSGRSAERRRLTALFCDLENSASVVAAQDPEDGRELFASFRRATTECIERFGGSIAQQLTDGVRSYFGWPEAHDNDAERAVRASLAILDAVSKLNERLQRPQLAPRIGIHTGLVVVNGRDGKDVDVFGTVPIIAARVLETATGGTVLATAETCRLLSAQFVVEHRGAQTFNGGGPPIQLYRLTKPHAASGGLKSAPGRQLTPFVGREDELRILMSRWKRVLVGEGQVVLIMGEPGIGKSRLLEHFRNKIIGLPHTWVQCTTAPFYQNTPFYPIIDMLEQLLLLGNDDSAVERLAKLESSLKRTNLKLAEAVPLITPLLNVEVPEHYLPLLMSPEEQRRRLLAVLAEWVRSSANAQPLVIVTEDLHWADPSTLELIQMMVEHGSISSLLLLCTGRPEFRAQWPLREHHTQITLNRLGTREVREMVARVAAPAELGEETIATVVTRSGGVPFFVEELTTAVLESGCAQLTKPAVPATLHNSLMSRLDRLGAAKEIAQVAAVIGPEFSYELLRLVHPLEEADLQRVLTKLTEAGVVYSRGIPPDATYTFRHVLFRDAAYEALLKSRRRELHREVAVAIDGKFPSLKEAHPEMLARHWAEAGEPDRAVTEWHRAGKAAEAGNAFIEARESYQQALALLDLLPESPERDLRELELAQSIVPPLIAIAGYSAPETVRAMDHAAVLAEKSGSLKQLVELMISRAAAYTAAGNFQAGAALADRALELALREGSSVSLGRAHARQIITRFFVGDFAGVEEYFLAALKFFEGPDIMRLPIGIIQALGFASWSAWTQGRADVARDREARMTSVGVNAYFTAWKAYYAAFLRALLREYDRAEAWAAQALELAEQHQFAWTAACARAALGDARWRLGRVDEGIALLRRGIAEMLEVEARVGAGFYTACLAEALEREGAILDALETVEQALQLNSEQACYRPEILKVRGELRFKQGQTEPAEADFREAIVLAQRMGAKAWELRATMSLARLFQDVGRRKEARTMLAELYNWFTEGFDTADLKEAKALLDELNG